MGTDQPRMIYALLLLLSVKASSQTCTQIALSTRDAEKTPSTPGYPISYANGLDVCWTIDSSGISKIADEIYIIQMVIDDVDMEKLDYNCYDYGEAYDGANATGTRLAKWCSTKTYIIVSSGSKFYVRFYSSPSNSNWAIFKGFSATLSVGVTAGIGSYSSNYSPTCISVALSTTNLTYTVTSPNYPASYTNSVDQCWVLYDSDSVPYSINYRIRFAVIDSQLETSSTCHYDDVQVRDGDEPTSTLIKMWCGETIPAVIISCKQSLYIRMRSDHFGTYRGFRILPIESQSLSTGAIVGISVE